MIPEELAKKIRYIQIYSRLEAYRMSYFPKTIIEWNRLPAGIVTASSFEFFREGLIDARANRVLA